LTPPVLWQSRLLAKSFCKAAGDKPSPEEVLASFVELNEESSESLRSHSLDSLGKPVIVYRQIRVSAMRIKGKHGTAVLQIESLGAPSDTQTGSQSAWTEQPLQFEKTKRGWVVSPIRDAVYVKREVALRVLSARLAELAQNTNATPGRQREQQQIVRLLNLLVIETCRAVILNLQLFWPGLRFYEQGSNPC
jgi:hypothetical protein